MTDSVDLVPQHGAEGSEHQICEIHPDRTSRPNLPIRCSDACFCSQKLIISRRKNESNTINHWKVWVTTTT